MQIASTENVALAHTMPNAEPSAVAWGAIIAGAVVAMVTSVVLAMLGSGLGFVAASPWSADADTAKALGIGAIVWLVVMQLVSAALGGFVGGRLRTRWTASADEVYFRDTAHGLLVWAVATLLMAIMFTSAATSAIGGAAKAGAAATGAAATAGVAATATGAAALARDDSRNTGSLGGNGARDSYYADLMLRPDKGAASSEPVDAQTRAEFGRLISTAVARGNVSQADSDYMARTIAARTGISQTEAEQRVKSVMTQVRQEAAEAEQKFKAAADQARKAAAHLSLWMVVSLFVGAFVAAYFGTVGGRMRDQP